MVKFVHKEESEITMDYVNLPALPGGDALNSCSGKDGGVTAAVPGMKVYRLVAVSFGLLCILQGALNISLRLALDYSDTKVPDKEASCNNLAKESAELRGKLVNFHVEEVKKSSCRVAAVVLGLLSLFLLAGVITLFFLFTKNNSELKMEMALLHNNRTGEKEQYQSSYNNLTEEKEHLQANYNRLRREKEQFQSSYNNLTEEKERLQANYNRLRREKEQLQSHYDDLTKKENQLQTEREQLQKKLEALTKEKNDLQKNTDCQQMSG